ncbi:MAG: hypothetical protein ACPGNV_06580 [Mangrovicoccus sp.]
MIRSSVSACLMLTMLASAAPAFTVHSNDESYMGAGTFYGPGRLPDSVLFSVVIRNVSFTSESTFVTPFFNNGPEEPNVEGEIATATTADGFFSDGVTMINENADVGPFELNGAPFLVGIGHGGSHNGEQISVLMDDNIMIMTMDIVFDMGVGAAGIVHAPFYGTTGTVTLPASLQTQYGLPGGVDQAGSLKPGDQLSGRLGDFDGNGMLDGAIAVTGNLPLTSIFMPGAPYALIRYFETDMPYEGQRIGELPASTEIRFTKTEAATYRFPEDAAALGAPVAE